MKYDPLKPPKPEEWLALDEAERLRLVQEFHRRARITLPNAKVHAVIHTIVENQVAMGDELPVRRTLLRLMAEGLDRHEALHAIGMELISHLNDVVTREDIPEDEVMASPYFAALERLTAEGWLRSFDEDQRTIPKSMPRT